MKKFHIHVLMISLLGASVLPVASLHASDGEGDESLKLQQGLKDEQPNLQLDLEAIRSVVEQTVSKELRIEQRLVEEHLKPVAEKLAGTDRPLAQSDRKLLEDIQKGQAVARSLTQEDRGFLQAIKDGQAVARPLTDEDRARLQAIRANVEVAAVERNEEIGFSIAERQAQGAERLAAENERGAAAEERGFAGAERERAAADRVLLQATQDDAAGERARAGEERGRAAVEREAAAEERSRRQALENSFAHVVGVKAIGEIVKVLGEKNPKLLAKSPLSKENTQHALELLGSFIWQAVYNGCKATQDARYATMRARQAHPGAESIVPNYRGATYEAFKNAEASMLLIALGKFFTKAGQKAHLTPEESKPWEKLPESMKWVAECALHAFARQQINSVQG